MLAALTNEGEGLKDALQMSFVHLMFNTFGIAIWYPIPLLRRAPIWLAKFLGNTTAIYRWFPIMYLFFMFLIFPLFIFALSLGGPAVLFGVLIPIICFIIFLVVINVIQRKRPQWLPEKFPELGLDPNCGCTRWNPTTSAWCAAAPVSAAGSTVTRVLMQREATSAGMGMKVMK